MIRSGSDGLPPAGSAFSMTRSESSHHLLDGSMDRSAVMELRRRSALKSGNFCSCTTFLVLAVSFLVFGAVINMIGLSRVLHCPSSRIWQHSSVTSAASAVSAFLGSMNETDREQWLLEELENLRHHGGHSPSQDSRPYHRHEHVPGHVCDGQDTRWVDGHINSTLGWWKEKKRRFFPDMGWGGGDRQAYLEVYDRINNITDQRDKMLLIQIVRSQVWVHNLQSAGDFTFHYFKFFIKAFQYLSEEGSLPSHVAFIMTSQASFEQYPTKLRVDDAPLFGSCQDVSENHAIHIPRVYTWFKDGVKIAPEKADWATKIPKAVFRGALSSFRRVPLLQLASKDQGGVLDIACTLLPPGAIHANGGIWHVGGPARWMDKYNLGQVNGGCGPHNRMEMSRQQAYRYIIVADGVGCADRVMALLSSSAILILQDSENSEMWHHDLVPFKHYLPTRRDFSDLEERVKWANAQPAEEMLAIVRNANEYAKSHLTQRRGACYLNRLFDQYLKVFPDMAFTAPVPGSTMVADFSDPEKPMGTIRNDLTLHLSPTDKKLWS